METQNLWPDFKIENIRSPKSILKEQAGYLMEKTKNILSAEVKTQRVQDKNSIYHSFVIVAPALGNYRFHLLNVSHEINYYPAIITVFDQNAVEADNEDKFIIAIQKIFNDPKTIRVISSLLAQSQEDDYIKV